MEINHPGSNEENQVDYLASLDDPILQVIQATTGQRLLNYIADNLLMKYGLSYITGMLIGSVMSSVAPELLIRATSMENVWSFTLVSLLIGYINYIIYYTLCEKLFKGYTFGKLITGTRAVDKNGRELSFKDSLLRSLCRLVPFELFSGLNGHPWHDRWTGTMVIKAR